MQCQKIDIAMSTLSMKNRITDAKNQLALKQTHPTDKSKNYVACNKCEISGLPLLSGCREYTHRRDQLFNHIKTVHKISYPGNVGQYEYEFDNHTQTTLPFAKKLRLDLDNSELRAATAAANVDDEVNNEAEVVTGYDLNLESQEINLHVPDIYEVGADKPSFILSIL